MKWQLLLYEKSPRLGAGLPPSQTLIQTSEIEQTQAKNDFNV